MEMVSTGAILNSLWLDQITTVWYQHFHLHGRFILADCMCDEVQSTRWRNLVIGAKIQEEFCWMSYDRLVNNENRTQIECVSVFILRIGYEWAKVVYPCSKLVFTRSCSKLSFTLTDLAFFPSFYVSLGIQKFCSRFDCFLFPISMLNRNPT